MEMTAYFRNVVRNKRPEIQERWIVSVLGQPIEEREQSDGRFAFWGLVPEAGNKALRVITLNDRSTVHNAFFDRGYRKARSRSPHPEEP
ncbi:MAG: hypothetical protein R6W06_12790 [Prochlorococcaceae cyanobacterium]